MLDARRPAADTQIFRSREIRRPSASSASYVCPTCRLEDLAVTLQRNIEPQGPHSVRSNVGNCRTTGGAAESAAPTCSQATITARPPACLRPDRRPLLVISDAAGFSGPPPGRSSARAGARQAREARLISQPQRPRAHACGRDGLRRCCNTPPPAAAAAQEPESAGGLPALAKQFKCTNPFKLQQRRLGMSDPAAAPPPPPKPPLRRPPVDGKLPPLVYALSEWRFACTLHAMSTAWHTAREAGAGAKRPPSGHASYSALHEPRLSPLTAMLTAIIPPPCSCLPVCHARHPAGHGSPRAAHAAAEARTAGGGGAAAAGAGGGSGRCGAPAQPRVDCRLSSLQLCHLSHMLAALHSRCVGRAAKLEWNA